MAGFGSVKDFLESIKKVLISNVHVGFILCVFFCFFFNLEVKCDPVISCQAL